MIRPIAAACLATAASHGQQPVFQMLPDNNASFSVARAVSFDGRIIAGERGNSVTGPVLWQDRELRNLPLVPLSTWGSVSGISASGQVISGGFNFPQSFQAGFWVQLTPNVAPASESFAVSPDGSTLVGRLRSGWEILACRVNLSTGAMTALPNPPGTSTAIPFASTMEGSVIVGMTDSLPVKWTGLSVAILQLPSGETRGRATAISYDGAVVAGYVDRGSSNQNRTLRWSRGVPEILVEHGSALAMSADGTRIVGEKGDDGFIWDPLLGERNLRQYLNAMGAGIPATSTWIFPASISGDGGTIAGYLRVNGSQVHAFAAHIPLYCYPNCDGSSGSPVLGPADFVCFIARFMSGDARYANCDGSTVEPVLNVLDFNCFLNRFAGGCP